MYTEDDLHFMKYQNSSDYNGLMAWPSMQKGLQLRIEDEAMLQKLLSELQSSKENKEDLVPIYTRKIEDILYGKGLTAKDRHEHMLKYGCATYTPQALQLIADSVKKSKYKGIIEIGAGDSFALFPLSLTLPGYGQWSRVLQDKYHLDIMAFDSFSNLPSILYQSSSSPSSSSSPLPSDDLISQFIFPSVQKGTARVLDRTITEQTHDDFNISRRALMIIYPDPGKMAYDSLIKYSENDSLFWNDLFIYVGEGRGGVNAENTFFDTLEGLNSEGKRYQWRLLHTCPLQPFGGQNKKGFERLFIFRRELAKPKQRYVHSPGV
jgi:hypothetical protein